MPKCRLLLCALNETCLTELWSEVSLFAHMLLQRQPHFSALKECVGLEKTPQHLLKTIVHYDT